MSENVPLDNPVPSVRRRRFGRHVWVTIALACVVFLAGVVTGAGFMTLRAEHRWHNRPSPAQVAQRITDRMKDQLKLSDAQAGKVRGILIDSQHFFSRLREQMQPKIRTEMNRVHDQINAVLSPAQRSQWKKMYQQMSNHWRWRDHHHWHHGMSPGSPGGPAPKLAPPDTPMMPGQSPGAGGPATSPGE